MLIYNIIGLNSKEPVIPKPQNITSQSFKGIRRL